MIMMNMLHDTHSNGSGVSSPSLLMTDSNIKEDFDRYVCLFIDFFFFFNLTFVQNHKNYDFFLFHCLFL